MMSSNLLICGYLSSKSNSFVGATKKLAESFPKIISNSDAASLTYFEGDDMRLMAGNTNKISSCTSTMASASVNAYISQRNSSK